MGLEFDAGATRAGAGRMPLAVSLGISHSPERSRESNGSELKTSTLHRHAIAVIRRLQELLEEETAMLISARVADLPAYNNRKGQGLMDLNRALAAIGGVQHHSEIAHELSHLKSKIDANKHVLKLHISAVKEIAALLTEAIQDAESDGTYSPAARGLRRTA